MNSYVQEKRQQLADKERQLAHEVEAAEIACADDEESADEEAYVDRKWRKIVLQPFSDAWRDRCRAACAQLPKLRSDPGSRYLL